MHHEHREICRQPSKKSHGGLVCGQSVKINNNSDISC